MLSGAIHNRAGTTTLVAGDSGTGVTAANRSIIQGNDSALVTSRDLVLAASGSVGAALGPNPARPVETSLSGVLDASAANGNVLVRQGAGDLRIGSVSAGGAPTAGAGRIALEADGNIVAHSGASLVQGGRVELVSHNGAIGSIAAPLAVNVGHVDNLNDRRFYGLKASAAGDIGIAARAWSGNPAGNLLVDTVVSAGGDVKLSAPGRILDNNPFEQIETRTWNELLAFWDSLGLRRGTAENAAKQEQAIRAHESGRTEDYRIYWLIRNRQADPATYDPAFVYRATDAERAALAGHGMTDAQIAQFEANRTRQYHTLHAQVGGFTTAFDGSFRYAATADERNEILRGSSRTSPTPTPS